MSDIEIIGAKSFVGRGWGYEKLRSLIVVACRVKYFLSCIRIFFLIISINLTIIHIKLLKLFTRMRYKKKKKRSSH
jgi:hypothetical protein